MNAQSTNPNPVQHKTQLVDDVQLFYREAGDPSKPTLLLLHGFPSSSFMFRNLIPLLKNHYHVIAPDYPGFGFSDAPSPEKFEYTYENFSLLLEKFLAIKKIEKFHLYIFDYGAPVGMRLIQRRPDMLLSLISQNGNIYMDGIGDLLKKSGQQAASDKEEDRKEVYKLFELPFMKWKYTNGVSDPSRISPDGYNLDALLMARPGNKEIQYLLRRNYKTNLAEYPKWQETLRKLQPPVLVIWGANDEVFIKEGAEAFKRDFKNLEFHLYPTGHFVLEEYYEDAASRILSFLANTKS